MHNTSPLPRHTTLAIFALLVLGLFAGMIRTYFAAEYQYATLTMMMDGTAVIPLQFRVLGAWIIKGIWETTGMDLSQLVRYYESVVFILSTLAIYLYGKATGLSKPAALLTGCALLFLYPYYFVYQPLGHFYYPGDTLSILFTALGLWLLAEKRFNWFAILLTIAFFNRESIVLLIPLFLFTSYKQIPNNKLVLYLVLYSAVFLIDKSILAELFGNNPGAGTVSLDHDIFHHGWPRSLETSRVYSNTLLFFSLDGALFFLSYAGFLWLPVLVGYSQISSVFVKRSLWLIPLSLLLMFPVANFNEPRIYADLAPIILIATAHALKQLRQESTHPC